MAAYATTAQLIAWGKDQRVPETAGVPAALVTSVLEAASRAVEHYCGGRVFTKSTAASQRPARTVRMLRPSYTPTVYDGVLGAPGAIVTVDDFWEATGVAVETAMSPLGPWQAVPEGDVVVDQAVSPGWPYTRLWVRGRAAEHARVTAKWGWAAVPDAVLLATLTSATSNLRRRYAPDGQPIADGVLAPTVVGDLSPASKRDLMPYRRRAPLA